MFRKIKNYKKLTFFKTTVNRLRTTDLGYKSKLLRYQYLNSLASQRLEKNFSPLSLAFCLTLGVRYASGFPLYLCSLYFPSLKKTEVHSPKSEVRAPQRMPLQSLMQRVKKRVVLFHSSAPVETSPLWRLIKNKVLKGRQFTGRR